MDRSAMEHLVAWKDRKGRMPLVLKGARQVGKTWLMKEFGRLHFESCAYVSFEDNPRMARLFQEQLDPARLMEGLSVESGVRIDPSRTLLLLDEVQEVPRALTALKYFQENAPGVAIVAAGSLLGVALHPGTSFPVGKVEFLEVHPMDFPEFLDALGEGALAERVRALDWNLAEVFRDKLTELLRSYLLVGGMPGAVSAYAAERRIEDARGVHARLLDSYDADLSKHAPPAIVPRIRRVWRSLPSQLARENRKFLYELVKEHARAREYELALHWLVDSGLVRQVHRVKTPAMPLAAYLDLKAFKLFCVDVGLLSSLSGLEPKSVLEGDAVFREFKGALTEQYVLQQLLAAEPPDSFVHPHYWSAERSDGEVDFLLQSEVGIVPIEVKASESRKAKSLRYFRDEFHPALCVRTSLSGFRREEWLVNVPLYAAGRIPALLSKESPPAASR